MEFYLKRLSELEGYTIKRAVKTGDNEFFGLRLERKGYQPQVIWFMSDDEGNGPGSFDIVDG